MSTLKTVTIQVGNTDNKLTQQEWADFVEKTGEMIGAFANHIYFFGAPPSYEEWQNACWVIQCGDPRLKRELEKIRAKYKQDSVAWTEGETIFL